MWIELQVPEPTSKMTLPYIYMRSADGNLVPWLASQTDLLSDDWMLAEDVRTHAQWMGELVPEDDK